MSFLNKILGTYSEREIKRIEKKYLKKINSLDDKYRTLNDNELKNKTSEFKERLLNGERLDDILIEAFAVCREASSRVLCMRPFDVQIIGGIVLHQGRIAEMKTGEGKTLVATLPAYLNALSGKSTYIVTVNDYLANRDANLLKPLYEYLGLTVSCITSKCSQEEKRELYKADIIYITNTELGFDYLRDNMVNNIEDKIQNELSFAIVDEVDSILIDEARTPLIISSQSDKPTHLYNIADIFVNSLSDEDYIKDEKLRSITLTESGVEKAEKVFGIENYADFEHNLIRHHIKQALQANFDMKKDIDYIVKNGEIVLIDEHTGRIADGRRFSNGLHQAIEAKEGLKIQKESITLSTITYQNFFRMFEKLSGMTGTALTEQEEFNVTYELDVVVIPTNKAIKREDKLDKLYMTEKAKMIAIINDIKENYEKGRPVLVGTQSIEKSEQLSDLLNKENIPHELLNAKNHELEAQIIAKAGEKGAITIATNMAGRGTDIKISDEVKLLGGLKVIGTERADNRRIDNQLRGRSGRQGDPGESQFYTSFDDKIIVFATDKFKELISSGDKDDLEPVNNKYLNKIISRCQRLIESNHFEQRKDTMKYDDVINNQRVLIYKQRDEVLNATCLTDTIKDMTYKVINKIVDLEIDNKEDFVNIDDFLKVLEPEYFDIGTLPKDELKDLSKEDIKAFLIEYINELIDSKETTIGTEEFLMICRAIILMNVDEKWQTNIDVLNDLKRNIKLRGYKQEDPIQSYITESYELFNETIFNIQSDTIKYILKLKVIPKQETEVIFKENGVKITS